MRGDAADGVQREHALRTQRLQRGQIGAVVDLVRRDRVALAVPGEEGNALAGQRAHADRPRGRPVRRDRLLRLDIGQLGQRIDAGAADDREVDGRMRAHFNA